MLVEACYPVSVFGREDLDHLMQCYPDEVQTDKDAAKNL